jgi:hypothetical protein
MSDDPFAAFKEGQPPAADEAPAKTKKPRKKKATAAKPVAVTNGGKGYKEGDTVTLKVKATTPKKTRKPRAAKEFRLPISTFLEIGSLTGEEGSALMTIATGLQKMGKKSRGKIVAALGKIFG